MQNDMKENMELRKPSLMERIKEHAIGLVMQRELIVETATGREQKEQELVINEMQLEETELFTRPLVRWPKR